MNRLQIHLFNRKKLKNFKTTYSFKDIKKEEISTLLNARFKGVKIVKAFFGGKPIIIKSARDVTDTLVHFYVG